MEEIATDLNRKVINRMDRKVLLIFGCFLWLTATASAQSGDRWDGLALSSLSRLAGHDQTARTGAVAAAYAQGSEPDGSAMFEPGLKNVGQVRVPDADQRITAWLYHNRHEIKRHLSGPAGRTPVPLPRAAMLGLVGLATIALLRRVLPRGGALQAVGVPSPQPGVSTCR